MSEPKVIFDLEILKLDEAELLEGQHPYNCACSNCQRENEYE